MPANRVPDELIAEILTPLILYTDAAFSDRFTKPLLLRVLDLWIFLVHLPSENQRAQALLKGLVECIPKWDKLRFLDFPYIVENAMHARCAKRSEALAPAIGNSPTIEAVVVRTGPLQTVPDAFREFARAPSLWSLEFIHQIRSPTATLNPDDALQAWVNGDLGNRLIQNRVTVFLS
ncbi:hypothetical protein C8R47DRAFT_1227936 [Mycena vitilis]|nr:hypothetical protein C8R47DRAFT_1227936 [Mycena vitilis]